MKAGIAGEDCPRVLNHQIVGRFRGSTEDPTRYLGYDALEKRGLLTLEYPVQQGIITNWDNMEAIWAHTFEELKMDSDYHPVLITQALDNPTANGEKIIQTLFETFNVPATFISKPSVLSLYAAGKVSGLALDSGDGVTQVIPIYEGYALNRASFRSDLGGRDITDYLTRRLKLSGYWFESSAEWQIARDIKEKLAYVSLDYHDELYNPSMPKDYELPDGQVITIGEEQFACAEAHFQPALIGSEEPGVAKILAESFYRSDIDIRDHLLKNIVISGGSTLYPGYIERLHKDLHDILHEGPKIQITAPAERQFSVWLGGSIQASLSTFQQMWHSKEEYEESGPSILHKRRSCY
eukprot:TRINITY_DN15059_c0_g1_i1.p1 TRINITY_DN15059_c0_g1~~TRINITY_DN15059_c0_g1_i1.p1  ORF type:complete len:366 (-),score=61.77 TRINITY_DN15059_c0_g1_i1:3-1058(-)